MDIAEAPKRLESITVRSGPGVVAAIAFSYVDHAGQKHAAGPWGGSGGQPHTVRSYYQLTAVDCYCTRRAHLQCQLQKFSSLMEQVQLGESEVVTQVSGTVGSFDGIAAAVTSIKFVTNLGSYGPWGEEKGAPFAVPVQPGSGGGGGVVGFFARSGIYLDAIGVYVRPSDL